MTVDTTGSEVRCDLLESSEIKRIRHCLTRRGWAMTCEDALGLSGMHAYLAAAFKDGSLIGNEVPGYPIERSHTRDVVEFQREGNVLRLNEYRRSDARPRRDLTETERRVYRRVLALSHPPVLKYLTSILSAVPENERTGHSTMGVDFMRTYGTVVPTRHQDDEQFVTICLVAREGKGATTTLYRQDDPEEVVVGVTLQPGDIMMFRDIDFTHDVSDLLPRFEADKVYRDVLVSTVHYTSTFVEWTGEIQ